MRKYTVVLLTGLLAFPTVTAAAEEAADSVSAYEESIAESAEQNRAFVDDEGDATATCAVSPFDPTDDSWSGSGYGFSGSDYAEFQASCVGADVDARDYRLDIEYWFEARMRPGLEGWDPVSPTFSCSSTSWPGTIGGRVQVMVAAPPASTTWFCPFTQSYEEGDPSIGRPHRLHWRLTTSTSVSQEGVSFPWPLLETGVACTPLTCPA